MRRGVRCPAFLLLLGVVSLLSFRDSLLESQQPSTGVISRQTSPARKFKSQVILITNATMVQPTADWMPQGNIAFSNCPNLADWMQCSFNSTAEDAEFVLFHARHLTDESLVPKHRPKWQKWVFFETEPPPKTWDRVSYEMEAWKWFNISVSYADDATILHNMYKLNCTTNAAQKSSGKNHAANKTGTLAWIVSNCASDSRREVYVEELMKHVQVDRFGNCYTDTNCGPYPLGAECINDLIEKYKFYLAFENAFCADYYTEKLAKTLPLNVIPVVMGFANYSAFLPQGSFINVNNFANVSELAQHLKKIASNDTLYNEYIEKKSQVQCTFVDTLPLPCKLCEQFHKRRGDFEYIGDARDYWSLHTRCASPKKVFSKIAPEIVPRVKTPRGFKALGLE
jgi:hypothetical protein